jgi:hypothetical protein
MAKNTDIGAAMKAQIARPGDRFAKADQAMAEVAELRPNVRQPGANDPISEAPAPSATPETRSGPSRQGFGPVQKNFSIPPADIELVHQIRSRAASAEAGSHILSQSEALRVALRAALALPVEDLGRLAASIERLKPGPKAGTKRRRD